MMEWLIVFISTVSRASPPHTNYEVITFGERPSSAFAFDLWYFPSPVHPFDTRSLTPSAKTTYSIDLVH